MTPKRPHGKLVPLLGWALLLVVTASRAFAALDLTGTWDVAFVFVGGSGGGTCLFDIVQTDDALAVGGSCEGAGAVALGGSVDQGTGDFAVSGPAMLCAPLVITAVATPDALTFSGSFTCGTFTGTMTGTRRVPTTTLSTSSTSTSSSSSSTLPDGATTTSTTSSSTTTSASTSSTTSTTLGPHLDLTGSWQLNLECPQLSGVPVTATQFLQIEQDVVSGVLTATAGPSCGTIVFEGAVRDVATCERTPEPVTGLVQGGVVRIPESGSLVDALVFATPFAWTEGGCVDPPLARFEDVALWIDGSIAGDGSGRGVRVVGIESIERSRGVDAAENVCFTGGAGACVLDMLRNTVAPGAGQTVTPLQGASVTFTDVIGPGTASIVSFTEAAAAVPATFHLLAPSVFYDVVTTATVTGGITVCLPYRDADHDGVVDGTVPPLPEGEVRLLHDEGGTFVDRTAGRDVDANRVCADVSSLSFFVLAHTCDPVLGCAPSPAPSTVLGKSFVVRDPRPGVDPALRSVVVVAKEPQSDDVVVGDPVRDGATVEIVALGANAGTQAFTLPAGAAGPGLPGWKRLGKGVVTGYRYSDPLGAHGPVKSALVRKAVDGTFLVKVAVKGALGPGDQPHLIVVPPAPGTEGGMRFTIPGGGAYCVAFGGPAGGAVTNAPTRGTPDEVFKVVSLPTAPTVESGCVGGSP